MRIHCRFQKVYAVTCRNVNVLLQVVAEVEAAVGSRLSNSPGRPEQLVVVLDCRGAPTLQARHSLAFSLK